MHFSEYKLLDYNQMNKEIHFLTPKLADFEDVYLEVREKEGWICSDEKVKKLPHVSISDVHNDIWKKRRATANKFVSYLSKKKPKEIIEVGCGNGWFSNFLAHHTHATILGIDINESELTQANRVFSHKRLNYAYADVFNLEREPTADIIVLNGSVQYFADPKSLIKTLRKFIKPGGEIHILDSPIYSDDEKAAKAKERTVNYFDKLGFPRMAKFYNHHTLNDFPDLTVVATNKKTLLEKILRKKISPFPWLKLS